MSRGLDDLGDRMKGYESVATSPRAERGLPVVIRLDGRSFSTFTAGLQRPYHTGLAQLMEHVADVCAREANARVAYTQSDEISLVLHAEDASSQLYFDGRIQKITSVLAGVAAVAFNSRLAEFVPERAGRTGFFDCRVWTVPNLDEAANTILWRELDAVKNSVSMLAECHFSSKQLHGRTQGDRLAMLRAKGVEWEEMPVRFKRGWYARRITTRSKFTTEELEALPPMHNARKNPDLEVERSEFRVWDPPPLQRVSNRVEALFLGADAVIRTDPPAPHDRPSRRE